MRVAFGMKAHSGWAATVVLGASDGKLVIVDRQRIELVEEEWAKQPYHAAEELPLDEAHILVKRGVDSARKKAIREIKTMVSRETKRKNQIAGCGVLVGNPMPEWSVDEILAVHFRMHKAEGVLFRDTLIMAARACGLTTLAISEKQLMNEARKALGKSEASIVNELSILGKAAGPPWGKDQKEAALAAMIALG